MWIPSYSRITGNERADEAAKNVLEEDMNDRELYPPQDLNDKYLDEKDRSKNQTSGHRQKTP
jgi:hypothetical protein